MSLKKKTPLFTVIAIGLFLIAITVWDVYVIVKEGTEASISYWIIDASYKYPMMTWMFGFVPGVLVGHLFWRVRNVDGTDKWGLGE